MKSFKSVSSVLNEFIPAPAYWEDVMWSHRCLKIVTAVSISCGLKGLNFLVLVLAAEVVVGQDKYF